MRRAAFGLGLLFVVADAQAACPATTAQLSGDLNGAFDAFAEMDPDAFGVARASAFESLACMNDPMSPVVAGTFHRLMALDAFLARDNERVLLSFRASHEVQPQYALPQDVAPDRTPLRGLWDEAVAVAPGARAEVGAPNDARVTVDGRPAPDRPTEVPSLLQLLSVDGTVQETVYLKPGDEAPAWSAPFETPEDWLGLLPPAEKRTPNKPLLFSGVGAVVGAGVLGGMALGARGTYRAAPLDQAETLRRKANTLGIAAQATAGGALALTTLAVAVRW